MATKSCRHIGEQGDPCVCSSNQTKYAEDNSGHPFIVMNTLHSLEREQRNDCAESIMNSGHVGPAHAHRAEVRKPA